MRRCRSFLAAAAMCAVLLVRTCWCVPCFADGPRVEKAPSSASAGVSRAAIAATSIDAGRISKGNAAEFEFLIRNSGQAPLEINAVPRCGCTVAKFDRSIAPGKEGKISASLRTDQLSGRVVKAIEMTTNDPTLPKVELMLSATIVERVWIDRPQGQVVALDSAATTTAQFVVRIDPSEKIQVTGVKCDQAFAHPTVKALKEEPDRGKAFLVDVVIDPQAPSGRTKLTVIVGTDSPMAAAVPVEIVCEKGLIASPSQIGFGVLTDARRPVARVLTLSRAKGDVQIRKIESSDPNLQARVIESLVGNRILVTYRGGAEAGLHKGTLRIETDDPEQPILEVPTVYRIETSQAPNR